VPDDHAKLLRIYLQDHFAGASGGLRLARRIRGATDGADRQEMERLVREIEEDRSALREIMDALDVSRDRVKQAGAEAGELLGRLKLNGRILSPSPLSRVVEFEGMIMGVTGKLELWRSLAEIAGGHDRLDAQQLETLIERAQDQRRRLEELHARAARAAFDPAGTVSRSD
jgi:hypothetical protein